MLKAAGKNPNDGLPSVFDLGALAQHALGRQAQVQIDTNNDSTADYVLEVTREKGLIHHRRSGPSPVTHPPWWLATR